MEFTTIDLGVALLGELKRASTASIAVAYFNPEDTILSALKKVPKFRLLVAGDFQANNPYKLESLCRQGVWIRAVPADSSEGKLHSKVFFVQRKDGSRWAMVGSANLTRPGLFSNQEACVTFDSRQPTDVAYLNRIKAWLDSICDEDYPKIDFEVAKAVYETRARYKVGPPKPGSQSSNSSLNANGYWALKPGWDGARWENFLAENVVAIGWNEIPGNPTMMSPHEIEKAYRVAWDKDSNQQVKTGVSQIVKFTQSIGAGDLVLICGRFDAVNKNRDAFIYGIARVDEAPFLDDKRSKWYRFKRRATIQRVEEDVPRDMIASALGKGSLTQTIHQLDLEGFERLAKVLRTELGVAINV